MLKTLRKPVLIGAGALILYALCGFLIIPAILQAQLPKWIGQATNRTADIERVNINPFTLAFSLQGFSLQDKDTQSFISFDRLAVDVNGFASLGHWAPVIDEVTLDKPGIRIAKYKNGEFNFSDLLKTKQPAEKKTGNGIFPFLVRQLTIANGSGIWEDRQSSQPEIETVEPIDLSVSELSTLGSDDSALHLSLVFSSGGRLDWTGNVNIQPLQSKGSIKLAQLSLPKLWQLFLQRQLPLELQNGTAAIAADYDFAGTQAGYKLKLKSSKLTIDSLKLVPGDKEGIPDTAVEAIGFSAGYAIDHDDQGTRVALDGGRLSVTGVNIAGTGSVPGIPAMQLQGLDVGVDVRLDLNEKALNYRVDNGGVALTQFVMSEPGARDNLLEIPKLALQGIQVDGAKKTVGLASISTEKATIKAWLNADGTLNYQRLFGVVPSTTQAPPQPAPAQTKAPATPWQVRVDTVTVKDYRLDFTDHTQQQPMVVKLSGLTVGLDHYSTEPGTSSKLQFSTQVNGSGTVKTSGTLVLAPLSADLSVAIDDIGLKTVQPYLAKYARLSLIDGEFDSHGQLALAMADQKPLSVRYQGNADIRHLLLRDTLQNKDFVKWKALTLGKIAIDLQQQRFNFEKIEFDKPYIRIVVNQDHTTNIHKLLIAQQQAAPATEKKPAAAGHVGKAESPSYRIGTIQVKQGLSDYADYSLILPFITQMNDLNGTVIGFSSEKNATAKLRLTGKVYDLASVDIAGKYQIDSGDSSFKLAFRDMPLPLVTPYMAEFAGYKIEKGQMSLDLSYTIDKGQLQAENKMFIDQFTLGDKVESPRAVSLPLKLAIALLKDPDGNINLELPVSGNLNDPQFSIGALVFKVLGNLIEKIATSPFHALASLVGGGEDLSEIGFDAGGADLSMAEKVKLGKLAQALKNRPSLQLNIKGASYQEQDWAALKSDALDDRLKKMKADELKAKGEKTRAEYVKLSDQDSKRLLAKLFIEKFPLLAEYSLFGKPQLKNPEAGDFYQIARQKLEAIMQPEPQRLENLAMLRASNIAKFVTGEIGVASGRVFILAPELAKETGESGIVAKLSLDASH